MERIPQTRHHDADVLAHALLKIAVGESITYDEMAKVIGCTDRAVLQTRISTARRVLQREHNVVFATQRGVGLIRCDPTGVVAVCEDNVVRIRRAARRTRATSATIKKDEYEALSTTDRSRLDVVRVKASIVEMAASEKVSKQIASKCDNTGQLPSLAATLDALK